MSPEENSPEEMSTEKMSPEKVSPEKVSTDKTSPNSDSKPDDLTATIRRHLNETQGNCSGAEIHASSANIMADLQDRYAIDREEAERQLEGWVRDMNPAG